MSTFQPGIFALADVLCAKTAGHHLFGARKAGQGRGSKPCCIGHRDSWLLVGDIIFENESNREVRFLRNGQAEVRLSTTIIIVWGPETCVKHAAAQ